LRHRMRSKTGPGMRDIGVAMEMLLIRRPTRRLLT